jgi:Ca2+-transporting ATPase
MWISVLVIGLYMFAVLIVILTTNIFVDTDDDTYRNTFLFNMFVWMQIWNEFNSRSTRFNRSPFTGLTKSFSFLWVVGTIALLQLIIVTVGGSVFSTVPLSVGDWAKSIGFAASVLVVSALVRLVGRATMNKSGPSTKPAATPADAVSVA